MGEELRHVQVSSRASTLVKEANNNKGREAESNAIGTHLIHYKCKYGRKRCLYI